MAQILNTIPIQSSNTSLKKIFIFWLSSSFASKLTYTANENFISVRWNPTLVIYFCEALNDNSEGIIPRHKLTKWGQNFATACYMPYKLYGTILCILDYQDHNKRVPLDIIYFPRDIQLHIQCLKSFQRSTFESLSKNQYIQKRTSLS